MTTTPPTSPPSLPPPRLQRGGQGWLALAGLGFVLTWLQLGVLVWLLARWEPTTAAWNAPWVPFWWWVHRGARLRAELGRPVLGTEAPWAEPVLTERRAAIYVWLAAACVVAASIAMGLQALAFSD